MTTPNPDPIADGTYMGSCPVSVIVEDGEITRVIVWDDAHTWADDVPADLQPRLDHDVEWPVWEFGF